MTDIIDPKNVDKSSQDNVINIKDAAVKKKPAAIKKPNQALICRNLADAVRRLPASTLPEFPVNYAVLEPKPGINIPLIISDDDTVTVTSSDALANDILRYCDKDLGYNMDYAIKLRTAKEAADYYLAVHPPLDPAKIKATRWADEPGLTYRRLPWIKETGNAPTWERLLGRMSNSSAFIEWVGSLFFEEAHLHNYVWIYGEGGDGKGSINRFLGRVFGNAYRSKSAPTLDKNGTVDKFWAYNLIGSRLAVFPDCESPTFTTSGLFKSLTGGDPVEVEAKGAMPFTVYLTTRYLILANVKPGTTSAKSDMRRIIYCEMDPTNEDDPDFEDNLWAEGGAFLSHCVENYQNNYPKHGPIKTDHSSLEVVIDENEQHLENFFNEYFEINQEGHVTPKDLKVAAEEAWPRSRKTYREFLAWLKRVQGVERRKERIGNATEWRYPGIARKKVVFAQKTNSDLYS